MRMETTQLSPLNEFAVQMAIYSPSKLLPLSPLYNFTGVHMANYIHPTYSHSFEAKLVGSTREEKNNTLFVL